MFANKKIYLSMKEIKQTFKALLLFGLSFYQLDNDIKCSSCDYELLDVDLQTQLYSSQQSENIQEWMRTQV